MRADVTRRPSRQAVDGSSRAVRATRRTAHRPLRWAGTSVRSTTSRLSLHVAPAFLDRVDTILPDLPDQLGLRRVGMRSYDTGVVFLHYERRRDG